MFNKVGISESNDKISPSLSDYKEAEAENKVCVDDRYIDYDTHLITLQIPSISDLMPAINDSGDEEITKDLPTFDEAIQIIKTLK